MALLLPFGGAARPLDPLTHPALDGVDIIPYLPSRLDFAQLVAQAAASGNYDKVLIDLPSFMQRPGWLNLPLALLPLVSLYIVNAVDGSKRAVAFSPSAPAAIAAWIVRQRGIALRCVEDAHTLNHPLEHMFGADVDLPEDYRVYDSGIGAYFAPASPRLEEAWDAAGAATRFFALQRAHGALQRVQRAAAGSRCLLVVDHQLWWLMAKAAAGESAEGARLFRWQVPLRGPLHLVDPCDAWVHGLLDDYPSATLAFWRDCFGPYSDDDAPPIGPDLGNVIQLPLRGARLPAAARPAAAPGTPAFDKRETLESVLAAALAPAGGSGVVGQTTWTSRAVLAFAQYLRRLQMMDRRALPDAAGHLLFAANACGGRPLARALRRALLAYPRPPTVTPEAEDESLALGALVAASNGRPLRACGQAVGSAGETERRQQQALAMLLEGDEDEDILRLLGRPTGGVRFAIGIDYRFHAELSRAAQQAARTSSARGPSRPCTGSVAGGIDWKATLASFASGLNEVRVFDRHRTARKTTTIDAMTPSVFLLDSDDVIARSAICPIMDANPARDALNRGLTRAGAGPAGAPDHVFSVVAAIRNYEHIHQGHIRQDTLSAIGFLCTSKLMGPARYALLARQPPRRHCRKDPEFEADFAGMTTAERLVAWAVKYGGNAVVVVAQDGWKPTRLVADYARQKNVEIVAVPQSRFPPHVIERMRRMCLVSCNLKQHPRRDVILDGLLE